ncbi:MAG: NAD-dependent deacylase [Nitrospirae bacterium]|nr:NAD-dependent deacylase [Nitrospirota bacterium]MBI3593451.1 NAD-dependent deacylase [Nitrospirota bacterium]
MKEQIEITKKRLATANAVTVLTGSGISADSGIPTFRGEDGLWKNHRAEDLATQAAFARDPRLVWEWYDWRRGIIATKEPNPGHYMVAELEKSFTRFHLITQNVDGLHEKGGSTNPIELHGNIWKVRCTHCHRISFNFDVPIRLLPTCLECGGLLRPHIVWFGEQLETSDMDKSYAAVQHSDVMFVIGTSGVVHPAASLAGIAKRNGSFLVEINLEKTPISGEMDHTFLGRAQDILPHFMG